MALSRLPLRRLCGLGQRELACLRAPVHSQFLNTRRLQLQGGSRLTHGAAAQSKIIEGAASEQQKAVGQQLREEWARYSRNHQLLHGASIPPPLTRPR